MRRHNRLLAVRVTLLLLCAAASPRALPPDDPGRSPQQAGAFHPNREGANAYFEAIRDELEKVADSAGWVVKE